MIRITCDICKKDTDAPFKYKLPTFEVHRQEDAFGNLIKYIQSNKVSDSEIDVCPTCRDGIARFIRGYTSIDFSK